VGRVFRYPFIHFEAEGAHCIQLNDSLAFSSLKIYI